MNLETTYALKLFFPNPAFIQIYFEAIANALDAKAKRIDILISTDGDIRKPSNLTITISDDGVGFTPDRFEKFREIKEPTDPYHKGMGRLVYLRYFSAIEVDSCYSAARRSFKFTDSFDGSSH
jgi:anti-sigma regulatory factor (Ser/Thr protein kinase)